MRTKALLLLVVVVALIADVCWAVTQEDLEKENAELRKRIERLEQQFAELQKSLAQAKPAAAEPPKAEPARPPAKPAPEVKLSEAEMQRIAEMVRKETVKGQPVWSNLDIQLYGFVKGDASYDTSRTTPGNYVLYLDSEQLNDNDDEFNMTANNTRLGLRINGPPAQDGGIQASGLIEFDFYGSYADENKAKIQMRHAYLKWLWPKSRVELLGGQTWDVVSPLFPDTLSYTVLWDAGNIGYRRPQMRLTKWIGFGKDTEVKLEGAMARTIGRSHAVVLSESGEDAGFPTFQARVGLTTPLFGKKTTIGVSGHWGEEEYDITTTGVNHDFKTWSVNLDVERPVNKWLAIKGEAFRGENLNQYLGGIGQGVNTTGTRIYQEIEASGGWVAATLGPWGKKQYNIGAGVDYADCSDLNSGARAMNRCIFWNVIHSFNKSAQVGLELSHWRTEYLGHGDADALRAQTSLIYKF